MKIAVLGAGAMGCLFGGMLSLENEVVLVDVNTSIVDAVNSGGVRIREKNGTEKIFFPEAVTDSSKKGVADLVIVFVKSMYSESALSSNRSLIGKDTYIMTVQNGAGHENILLRFADRNHVIIGSTQHNSSVIENGFVSHGGSGQSFISSLGEDKSFAVSLAKNMSSCGLECSVSENVRYQIWHKLFTNTSASILTAILQVPLGFIGKDVYANTLMRSLVKEAVLVAAAMGLDFCEETIVCEVQRVCDNAPDGYTSIYADIRDGRRTEVDTISGSVIRCAHDLGLEVPYHEMAVALIHSLENKGKEK